jgi:hypothetical protein
MIQVIKTVMHLLKKHPEFFYFLHCIYEFTNFSHVDKNYIPGFKKAIQTV